MAKKQALGKGLGALISSQTDNAGRQKAQNIALSSLKPNPYQPRRVFDKKELNKLANSIRQHGVLQPILIRPAGAKYEIIAGERRYTASKLAGLKEIPAYVKDITDADARSLALIENVQRVDLNPIEEATAYAELMQEQGITQEALAQLVSKSRPVIANSVRLLELPKQVQELIASNKLSVGHSRVLQKVKDGNALAELVRRVVRNDLSVRETEELVNGHTTATAKKTRSASPRQASEVYNKAASAIQKKLGRTVKVKGQGKHNALVISFKDEKDFKKLLKELHLS